MDDIADIFSPHGPLAGCLPGFAPREEQRIMAEAVARALREGRHLMVEAGTGVGKTFAYLVPALASGQRVIVSTATKNLQDQLHGKDLPEITAAMGRPVKVSKLKGRANYLCTHRLGLAREQGRLPDRDSVAHLARIEDWARITGTGDVAELADIPEDARIWPRVTSTVENCLGTRCPDYEGCHVVNARREAQDSEVVIVNHHLLLADLALKVEGFGDLLPGTDAVIVDEAHRFPDIAGRFFGDSVSTRQLMELGRDLTAEARSSATDPSEAERAVAALDRSWRELRLALGEGERQAPWEQMAGEALDRALDAVAEALDDTGRVLEALAPESAGLEQLWRRLTTLRARFELITERVGEVVDPDEIWVELDEDLDDADAAVRWIEVTRHGAQLHRTPLDTGRRLRPHLEAGATWVFTSATLAVGEDFDHLRTRLGLDDARTLRLESPFDYPANALLYLPEGLPEPRSPDHTEAVIDAARPVMEASRGRAFLLFTSYRALNRAARLLEGSELELLVQGTAPRDLLIRRFRELPRAVLLGTASFWEGVDVRGPALSVVVIDKLPFTPPDDPVMAAQIDRTRARGGDAFGGIQVPQAVIALKQGVGRLIRDVEDTGVMVLGDPRILTKGYGRRFLDSLPPMARTRALDEVRSFISERVPEPGA